MTDQLMRTTSNPPRTLNKSLPKIVLRASDSFSNDVALDADPDWEKPMPSARSVRIAPVMKPQHPATKGDFMKLEDCGRQLAKKLGWGPLQGVAIRESGQIAAQRYGYSSDQDKSLGEEAFSLLLSAL